MTGKLAALIEAHVHDEGILPTVVPGLLLGRFSRPQAPYHGVIAPTLAIVGQGAKTLVSGANRFSYDHGHYVVATHELALTIGATRATRAKPYLGLQYA